MNKKEKSAARKRTFRSEQTDEAKADASAQLQARMTAHRNQQSEEEKDQARLSDNAARSVVRGKQSEEEKIEESEQAQSQKKPAW